MKKFITALLKAALYTFVFLGIQLLVTLILSVLALLIQAIRGYVTGDFASGIFLMDNLVSAVTIVSGAATLLFLWFVFAVRGKSFSGEVRWHRMPSAGKAMLGPVECGFGLSILSSFVLALLPFPEAWYATYDESMELLMSGNPVLLTAATVIAAPFVEEVIFRGLVYTRLCRGMKTGIAALLSAVIFGLVHGTLLHLVYIVPMGLMLCLFYEKYRSLWAPILLHIGFNLAGSVLDYYNIESEAMMIVLIAIGVYLTVMGLLSMRWYRRDQGMHIRPTVQNAAETNPTDLDANY